VGGIGAIFGAAGGLAIRADFSNKRQRLKVGSGRRATQLKDVYSILELMVRWTADMLDVVTQHATERWFTGANDDELTAQGERRTISASRCASAASDFAPEVECRERYCPTENGLIANTS